MIKSSKTAKTSLCPVDNFQQMISGKYKLRIIWDLQAGPRRYNEIKKGLLQGKIGSPEIAARVLSRELKALTERKMIVRKDYKVVPPKVEYTLTPFGRSLIPLIATMHKWGTENLLSAPERATFARMISQAAE